jgi:hypothetical protein
VFDALDECFAGTREALLNFISEFNRTTQRIMITIRLDEPIWRENLNDATVVHMESDLKDLRNFIKHRLTVRGLTEFRIEFIMERLLMRSEPMYFPLIAIC